MKAPRALQPLYLARATYRLRRLMDAARLLPVVGLVLVLLPLMRMPSASGLPEVANETVYLFAVWLLLVLAALALSRALGSGREDGQARPEERPAQTLDPDPVSRDATLVVDSEGEAERATPRKSPPRSTRPGRTEPER